MTGAVVRVTTQDGEPWFVAKDVREALGLETGNLQRVLDENERMTIDKRVIGILERGNRSIVIVNESGLIELIFRSRKFEAKAFKRWIKRTYSRRSKRTAAMSWAKKR